MCRGLVTCSGQDCEAGLAEVKQLSHKSAAHHTEGGEDCPQDSAGEFAYGLLLKLREHDYLGLSDKTSNRTRWFLAH